MSIYERIPRFGSRASVSLGQDTSAPARFSVPLDSPSEVPWVIRHLLRLDPTRPEGIGQTDRLIRQPVRSCLCRL